MLKTRLMSSTPYVVVLLLLTSGIYAQSQTPPNVILIITDEHGYGDLGLHGNPHVKTPILDQLANQSTLFTTPLDCSQTSH